MKAMRNAVRCPKEIQMIRNLVIGAAVAVLLPFTALATPIPTRQSGMSGGVRAVYDAASGKQTVYGAVIPFTFTKQEQGKMLEVVVDSPKPVVIELWSGDIALGSVTWDKMHKFLGSSGKAPELKPSLRWMTEPGSYTALVLTTLPPGSKPDPFVITYGKETRVPTAEDTKEWNKKVAKATIARTLAAQAKRSFAPNFSTVATDRNPISPQMYRGKVLLIEFTSGNAQPVLDDIGFNQATYRQNKDKGFDMITVYLDTDQAAYDALQNQFKPEWREIFDSTTGNSAIADKYAIDDQSLPETFLIDASGRLVARDVHREALNKLVLATLAEAKAYKEALLLDDDSPDTTNDSDSSTPAAGATKPANTTAK
jgi:hypothetical protein